MIYAYKTLSIQQTKGEVVAVTSVKSCFFLHDKTFRIKRHFVSF
jgi:hypothetical protein